MAERISKSALKRRFKEEEEAAAALADLSDRDLAKLEVGERLKEEVRNCRGLKGGSKKRQIKYLAKVMRDDSVEAVFTFLEERKGSNLKEKQLHREAERLRDVLINETLDQYDEYRKNYEDWDMDWSGEELEAALQNLDLEEKDLRSSLFQFARNRGHNHSKTTYRILRAALEKKARTEAG